MTLPNDVEIGDWYCRVISIDASLDTFKLIYECNSSGLGLRLEPIMVPLTTEQGQRLLEAIREQLD